jgi:hypothetical protein
MGKLTPGPIAGQIDDIRPDLSGDFFGDLVSDASHAGFPAPVDVAGDQSRSIGASAPIFFQNGKAYLAAAY